MDETRYAGVGHRGVALVIDAVTAFLALGVPVAIVAGRTSSDGGTHTATLSGRPFLVWLVLSVAYFTAFEATLGGPPGKLVVGLRVRAADGMPIGWSQAIVRNLLRVVDAFPYVIPYVVGAVAAWSGDDRQRVGDRVARTVVTYR